MNKQERVYKSLHCEKVDKFPIFIASTFHFMLKALHKTQIISTEKLKNQKYSTEDYFQLHKNLDLDIIQTSHPSFYPSRFELPIGAKYQDEWGRNHILSEHYDDFCAPFPLQPKIANENKNKVNQQEIRSNWENYEFPNPLDDNYFNNLKTIQDLNNDFEDPMSIWGIINGPFEPTWQLLSDGWPAFFVLAHRDMDLAKEIINRVADYSIQAGVGLIRNGVNAIRIGDDYALNHGLMVRPKIWKELIYPAHKKLIEGLKKEGGSKFPVILHSDGDISTILKCLTASGIDALNPIQPDAIDLGYVVDQVGNKLAMTGAFDLRFFLKSLVSSVKIEIENEVNRLFKIIKDYNSDINDNKLTGFCIGPSHNIQAGSKFETFMYWLEIVKKNRNLVL